MLSIFASDLHAATIGASGRCWLGACDAPYLLQCHGRQHTLVASLSPMRDLATLMQALAVTYSLFGKTLLETSYTTLQVQRRQRHAFQWLPCSMMVLYTLPDPLICCIATETGLKMASRPRRIPVPELVLSNRSIPGMRYSIRTRWLSVFDNGSCRLWSHQDAQA